MFSVLAGKAKSSKKNKTGSWRSLLIPKVLHDKCISCGLCKFICPEGCIEKTEDNKYVIDLEYCKGCGLCVYICPKKAIEMVIQEEESSSEVPTSGENSTEKK